MLEDFKRYWHGDQDEVQLLLDLANPDEHRRQRIAAVGAIAAELLLITIFLNFPGGGAIAPIEGGLSLEARNVTQVFVPRDVVDAFRLTQKAPQRAQPASEVNLEQLLPRPASESSQPPAPSRHQALPAPAPPQAQVARLEPPSIELPQQGVTPLPSGPAPVSPPPKPEPRLAFERVGPPQGAPKGAAAGQPALRPPSSDLRDIGREAARSGAGGRLAVGDVSDTQDSGGGIAEMLRQSPAPGRTGSALELLSDPQGVDFRPYLTQVLAIVRRNWMNVMPESARFGQRGRVVVQFSVDRTGQVPKLVIASTSGTTGLDRGAVAGISASVPLPYLPDDYRGAEVRLQLVFSYNMPKR